MEETKRCQWCAEEVLAAAVKCKHCGGNLGPVPTDPKSAAALGQLIIGLVLMAPAAYFFYDCSKDTKSSKTQEVHKDDVQITAWVMAQGFVKKRLKSPGTADFGSVFKGDYQSPDDHVKALGGDRYEASGWVDSQNGFGALVRTNFSVTMERDSTGTWTAIEGPTLDSK